MEFGPQKIAGAIVSARLIPGDKDRAEHEQLTLLMDSGELRNVDLSAATAIRFTDPKLQLQFKDYLARADQFPLERQAQRLHRFHRCEIARSAGELHHADASLEIELSADAG